MRRFPPWHLSLLAAVGCTQVTFSPLNAPPHPVVHKSPSDVEVFSAGPPAKAHVDVGMLQIRAWGAPSIENFRAVASQHGCDALVMVADDVTRATCLVYAEVPKP